MINGVRRDPICRHFCAGVLGVAILLGAANFARCADDPIRMEPGTVLEIAVIGIPEFRYRVTVNNDGEASFPLLEPLQVDGMTLTDLRRKIKERMGSQIFRERKDGQSNYLGISPNEVTIDVVKYRPVYVSGDVEKPGELAYEPRLTVRQAVALAGGYDLWRKRTFNPFLQAADLRSESEAAWIDLAKNESHLVGLQALLSGKLPDDLRSKLEAPLRKSILDEIAATEMDRVRAMDDDFRKEVAHLKTVVADADLQVRTLQQDEQTQQKGIQQQSADLEHVRALYAQKVVPLNRVSEEQRETASAQQRILSVTAQLADATRLREDAQRKLQAAADQRRIKLLGEIQDTTARIETVRAQIHGLDDKMVISGAAKSELVHGSGTAPQIVVHRTQGGTSRTLVLDEDAVLRPGDVVDVTLKSRLPALN